MRGDGMNSGGGRCILNRQLAIPLAIKPAIFCLKIGSVYNKTGVFSTITDMMDMDEIQARLGERSSNFVR
jgi:hypothetical protein